MPTISLALWKTPGDIVQDVLTKFYSDNRDGITNGKAYLIRSVINHAINSKTRRRRTVQPEVWLPEPVATESADANVYLKDILSYSLLVLLEKLNAKERAVFILKESFDYPHDEIASILSITEEHSRKLLSRAKDKLFKPRATPRIRDERTNTLLRNYIDAIRDRNMQRLEGLLAEDIAFYADGGANVNVVKKVCTGNTEVANLLSVIYQRYQQEATISLIEVNHQPALLFRNGDRLTSCLVFDISPEDNRITRINSVVDPEKLKNFG
ncbi:sigma-70 family RNA polymerase sigma factor [Puia sp. P3]|uniref:sigma-70 family RNA polymerase sigma factor n=1 Tax=Puia sp. P3 TaxID=3423952 RepID=UPI003D67A421